MTGGLSSTSVADFVAEAPDNVDMAARRRFRVIEPLQDAVEHVEAGENGLRRRAHRQALAMMVASGTISTLALYGVWVLLRSVI